MTTETCAICGATAPVDGTVHVTLNPMGSDGINDYFVCQPCYEDHFEPLFP